MKSIYEQLGGTYSQVGDYFLPNNIKLAEMPDSHRPAQREEPFSDAEKNPFQMQSQVVAGSASTG